MRPTLWLLWWRTSIIRLRRRGSPDLGRIQRLLRWLLRISSRASGRERALGGLRRRVRRISWLQLRDNSGGHLPRAEPLFRLGIRHALHEAAQIAARDARLGKRNHRHEEQREPPACAPHRMPGVVLATGADIGDLA